MDSRVVPAVASEEVGVLRAYLRRPFGEFDGVVAERADLRLEVGLSVVVLRVFG